MRQDNEAVMAMAKQFSNNIEFDISKYRSASDELKRQILDFTEMKEQLDEILEKLKGKFNFAQSEDHTLEEFMEMKDEIDNLWKQIKATAKRFNDVRMKSMHVMHQNTQNENDKLKEKLDETIIDFDNLENDRDNTKNENDRLKEEVIQQTQNITCMDIEIEKLKSGI